MQLLLCFYTFLYHLSSTKKKTKSFYHLYMQLDASKRVALFSLRKCCLEVRIIERKMFPRAKRRVLL